MHQPLAVDLILLQRFGGTVFQLNISDEDAEATFIALVMVFLEGQSKQ